MKSKHIFTSEEKLDWFGYGPWVEEPDLVLFVYKVYQCRVIRVVQPEPYATKFHMFGGYLCGYVRIPFDHSYYHAKYEDIPVDCHGGLTYGEVSEGHWIGFDCAHSGDYQPSIEKFKNTSEEMIELKKRYPTPEKYRDIPLFNPTYKSVHFCIDECKGIVDQLIVLDDIHKEKDNDNRLHRMPTRTPNETEGWRLADHSGGLNGEG